MSWPCWVATSSGKKPSYTHHAAKKKTKDKTWENGRKIQICEMQSYKQVNILILVQKHLKNIIYYIFTLHSGISLQVIKGSNWHCIKAVMQKLQIIIHLENHSIGQTRSTLFSHFVKSTNFALIKCKNCHSTKYIALIYCSKHSESQIKISPMCDWNILN